MLPRLVATGALIVVLLLGLAAWLMAPRPEASPTPMPAGSTGPTDGAPGRPALPTLAPDVAKPLRVDTERATRAAAPSQARTAAPTPARDDPANSGFELEIRAVDSLGRPVADATVEMWIDSPAPNALMDRLAALRPAYSRRFARSATSSMEDFLWSTLKSTDPTWAAPVTSAQANSQGVCRMRAPRRAITIVASKPGAGSSGAWSGNLGDEGTIAAMSVAPGSGTLGLRLELRPSGRLTGAVLDREGRPISQATVYFGMVNLERGGTISRKPVPQLTDTAGRFTADVDAPFGANAFATDGEDWTPPAMVVVSPGGEQQFVLRFAGAYVIEGTALSPEGRPQSGVRIEASGNLTALLDATAITAADGSFSLEFATAGNRIVFGSAQGLVQDGPSRSRYPTRSAGSRSCCNSSTLRASRVDRSGSRASPRAEWASRHDLASRAPRRKRCARFTPACSTSRRPSGPARPAPSVSKVGTRGCTTRSTCSRTRRTRP